MISTSEVRKGVIIELEGQLMQVLESSHIKIGRGSAQVRLKLRNVRKGDIVERTFQAGTKWPRARVEQRKTQYLYSDGSAYHFMDPETYDQFAVSDTQLGENARFLKDGMDVHVSFYEGEILGVELPVTVDLRVTSTERGVVGDTAGTVRKPATLETGHTLQVPLFVAEGDMIRVDTRTGEYQTRIQ